MKTMFNNRLHFYVFIASFYVELRAVKTVIFIHIQFVGMWWCGRSRHCSTSRKVTGSIPDCVNGIFSLRKPSLRNMALCSTPRLTEMSTTNIVCGLESGISGRFVRLTNLPP